MSRQHPSAAKAFEQEKVNLYMPLLPLLSPPAKEATQNVPIVLSIGGDPVALGLVNDFAKRREIRRRSLFGQGTPAKRIEILEEMLPKISRVVDVFDPTTRSLKRAPP